MRILNSEIIKDTVEDYGELDQIIIEEDEIKNTNIAGGLNEQNMRLSRNDGCFAFFECFYHKNLLNF